MAAMRKPENSDGEPKLVRDFRARYGEALEHARVSAEHTATEGWQALYTAHQERMDKDRDNLAARLETTLEALRKRVLSEDEEKELGKIKTEVASLRESDEWFRRQTIDPVIQPLYECQKVIDEYMAEAKRAQREAPLHASGMVDIMQTVVDTMPRVKFLTASGQLKIGAE